MTIHKPRFPNPTTADVARRLERLEERIGSVRNADGSVDVQKLKDAAAADPALKQEVSWIEMEFSTREMRRVTGACGGTSLEEVDAPPAKLDDAQVQNVLGALLEAKQRLANVVDKDGSGRIERDEAVRREAGPGLAGHLAREAVRDVERDYQTQLAAWREALQGVADKVDPRRGLELNIEGMAKRHCETELGTEAVKWAYRKMAIEDGLSSDDVWDKMGGELRDAERSLLRFVPFFGEGLAFGAFEGHLGDDEVRRAVGSDDLAGFIRDTKAALQERLGMSYEDWVAGKDIPGADQLEDGDFYRKTSSGC